MSDQTLMEAVRQADPVPGDRVEPPHALFERVLAGARAEAPARSSVAESHRRLRQPRSRWMLAAGAVATVALATVVATALLPAGDAGSPSPAAAAVLLRAAHSATKQPATGPPRPGQFVYTKS